MPTYTLQGPDGRTYTIEGPEGATAEQLGAFVQSQAQAADRELYSPTRDMSGLDKFIVGAGKAVSDTGQGLGQIGAGIMDYLRPRKSGQSRTDEMRGEVAETRRLDAPIMDTGAGFAGNIGGNIAMALLPGGAMAGAGRAISQVPNAARLGQALMAGGRGIMAPSSIPAAMGVGAAQGAIQPSTSTGETMMNAGLGGAAAGAVPLAIRGVQVGRSLLDPFSDAGQARIIGRGLNTAAGTADDAKAAMKSLQAAAPLVPGSLPTAGQSAQNPGIAALERTAVATDPVASAEMARRLAAQNEARIGAVEGIAGTPAMRKSAEEARADAAQVAYGRSRASDAMRRDLAQEQAANQYEQGIGLSVGTGLPKQTLEQSLEGAIRPSSALEKLAERPAFKSYIAAAQTLAKNKGQDIGNPLESIDGLHYIKLAIDDALSGTDPTQALGRNAKAATVDMKERLITEMDKISPAYAASREAFQQSSRPINQMALAEQLLKPSSEGGAVSFRGDMTPAAFARRLSDKTAADVTNFKGATLQNTMEPDQLATLNAVRDDLLRKDFAETAGRGVGSDTVQKLAYSNMMNSTGLPSWVTGVPKALGVGGMAQRFGDLGYKSANEEMRAKLAQALMNPNEVASLMEAGMVTPEMQRLVQGLSRGGAAVGAASPYLLNTTKE
jgi:hypothetical protein